MASKKHLNYEEFLEEYNLEEKFENLAERSLAKLAAKRITQSSGVAGRPTSISTFERLPLFQQHALDVYLARSGAGDRISITIEVVMVPEEDDDDFRGVSHRMNRWPTPTLFTHNSEVPRDGIDDPLAFVATVINLAFKLYVNKVTVGGKRAARYANT